MSQQPGTRVGDADREAAVSALADHYAAGRLTKEEFDERSEQAWAARTASGLWPLFADLPRPQAVRTVAPAPPPPTPRRGHPGWRHGAGLAPVLAVVAVLVVLTHLPVFLLVALVWVVLARTHRHWGDDRRHHRGQLR